MKQKISHDYSGITVCDSIVVSVLNKRLDLRKLESVIIALIGFVSVIMSFLKMFKINYNIVPVFYAAFLCSLFYIIVAVLGKKALWAYFASIILFFIAVFKFTKQIYLGFKYIYNDIYSQSLQTKISYYKFLEPEKSVLYTTVFLVFAIWLLAIVIYFFTIYKPNLIITVLFTFPIIEIGLYNGIDIPIVWGMLTISFWLAHFAMCTIDIGEYSGGNSGFVRKGNLFYPKRKMRLKVTEKCALYVIYIVIAVTLITLAFMNASGYKRSDKLNERRTAIKQAVTSFTFEDFTESVSGLTQSFGFTFEYENHKLGNISSISYKNTTDLEVTFDKYYDSAIYLKGYVGSVYNNNEWFELDEKLLKKEKQLFDEFKKYSIYPQDFPHNFLSNYDYLSFFYDSSSSSYLSDTTVWIKPKKYKNKNYAPYFTNNHGGITYNHDTLVASSKNNNNEYSYKFFAVPPELISYNFLGPTKSNIYNINDVYFIDKKDDIINFCTENQLLLNNDFTLKTEINNVTDIVYEPLYNYNLMMNMLLENKYRDFVYENYLHVPENENMSEVREEFKKFIDMGKLAVTAAEKYDLLLYIRQKISSMTEYSLSPGKTPNNRDFVNYFLLENHKGYCTHFATSGVLLARMAGIPARYATGYIVVGEDFNDDNYTSDGTYSFELQDNRSHAWAEIYLDGFGWIPFEFTSGYSNNSINTETSASTILNQTNTTTSSTRKTSSTNKNSSSKNSSLNTSDLNINTTTATKKGIEAGKPNNTISFHLSESHKIILLVVTTLLAALALVFIRRYIILYIRKKRFNNTDKRKAIANIYVYSEKLIHILGLKRKKMSYNDFADLVKNKLGNFYFNDDDFSKVTQIALKGCFSNNIPDDSEINFAGKFADNFANKLYSNSKSLRKLYLKYILVVL